MILLPVRLQVSVPCRVSDTQSQASLHEEYAEFMKKEVGCVVASRACCVCVTVTRLLRQIVLKSSDLLKALRHKKKQLEDLERQNEHRLAAVKSEASKASDKHSRLVAELDSTVNHMGCVPRVPKFWTHRTKIYCFCDTSVREKAWRSCKRVAQAT